MKTVNLMIVIGAVFSLSSCFKSKEKTCECTTTYSDPSYTPVVQEHETTQECSYWEDSYVSGNLTAVTTCEEI